MAVTTSRTRRPSRSSRVSIDRFGLTLPEQYWPTGARLGYFQSRTTRARPLLSWRFHSRETESFFVELNGRRKIANTESDHTDSWLHCARFLLLRITFAISYRKTQSDQREWWVCGRLDGSIRPVTGMAGYIAINQ